MSDWHLLRIASNRAAANGLFHLDLDVGGTPVEGTHALPGQYLKLAVEGHKESFFAIASAPDPRATRLELLIKTGSPLADALRTLPAGAEVRASAVQGKGFPIDQARGRDVYLFATGSGISPVRSLIDVIRRDRAAFHRVKLYFGARTPDAFAYDAELPTWDQDRIDVVRTVSKPGDSGWTGLTGYVQAHIPEEPLGDAVAFLCGQKDMVRGVTEALLRQGLPKERIFLNF